MGDRMTRELDYKWVYEQFVARGQLVAPLDILRTACRLRGDSLVVYESPFGLLWVVSHGSDAALLPRSRYPTVPFPDQIASMFAPTFGGFDGWRLVGVVPPSVKEVSDEEKGAASSSDSGPGEG